MTSGRSRLEDAFEALADPGTNDAFLASVVERTLAGAAQRGALARELVLCAALPRSFTTATLAAMTDRSVEDPEFAEALSVLLSYPFVTQRAGDSYGVHESVRLPILDWWASSADPGVDRDAMLQRLLSHLRVLADEAMLAAEQLSVVAPLIRDTDVARHHELSESVYDALARSVVELFHVAMRIDRSTGLDLLMERFTVLDGANLVELCDLLVRALAEEVDAAEASERIDLAGWHAYWAARVAIRRRDHVEALRVLDAAPEPEDLTLRVWLRGQRSSALQSCSDFAGALASLDDEIAFNDEHRADPWNVSVSWLNKAQIYREQWRGDDERDALLTATRRAAEAGNVTHAAGIAASLADLELATGDLSAAAASVLQSFRSARQSVADIAGETHRRAALFAVVAGVELLGPQSAGLLGVLAEQNRQLVLTEGASGRLEVLLREIGSVISAGDRERMDRLLAEGRALVAAHLPDDGWRVDATEVQFASVPGTAGRGSALLDVVLAEPRVLQDRWETVRTRMNGAMCLILTGEFDRALAQIGAARETWAALPHPRALELTWVLEAEVLRRRGQLQEAAAALGRGGSVPARGYEGARHEIGARLALDCSDVDRAVDLARAAWTEAVRSGGQHNAMQRGVLLLECLVDASRFDEAATVSAELAAAGRRMRAFAAARPSDDVRLAWQHAGRAVRILVTGHGGVPARVRSAREHLEESLRLDPEQGWYHVEVGFLDLISDQDAHARKQWLRAAKLCDVPQLQAALTELAER